jgi:hypothetical protein
MKNRKKKVGRRPLSNETSTIYLSTLRQSSKAKNNEFKALDRVALCNVMPPRFLESQNI